MEVVSLYDHSGAALTPWAVAGYACYAYDIANSDTTRDGIQYCHADLYDDLTVSRIVQRHPASQLSLDELIQHALHCHVASDVSRFDVGR